MHITINCHMILIGTGLSHTQSHHCHLSPGSSSFETEGKNCDHLHLGDSGEGGSGYASCSCQHSGNDINTGPSAAWERPLVGCHHLPPTCYRSDVVRKNIMPTLIPLQGEKSNFKLFSASDNADYSPSVLNEGHGTELHGNKLEQQQQDPVPSLQQMTSSSVKIAGNISSY
jgi:hypothetical protein